MDLEAIVEQLSNERFTFILTDATPILKKPISFKIDSFEYTCFLKGELQ